MAISEMRRMHLIVHQSFRNTCLELLQELGVVSLEEETSLPEDLITRRSSGDGSLKELENSLLEINFCLDFINKHSSKPASGLSNFFPQPLEIKVEEFKESRFDHTSLYKACRSIEEQIQSLRSRLNRLLALQEFLSRIAEVTVPLEDVGSTRYTQSFLIELSPEKEEALKKKLSEVSNLWEMEVFPGKGKNLIAFLVIHKEISEALEKIIQGMSLSILVLPQAFEGTPAEAKKQIEQRMEALLVRQKELLRKAALYSKFERDLKIAHDYYLTELERREKESILLQTSETAIFSGWVRKRDIPLLEKVLKSKGQEWALFCREPHPDEDVPVFIENNRWVQNFEVLTRLYGLPNYREIDPTPLVAGFFFLFFGICLGDVIYGLILALLGFLGASALKIPESTKQFFRMLAWGGVASLVIGILTGSWLGDLFDYLPPSLAALKVLKQRLTLIDPINNPLPMLVFSLLLGIVQVLVGVMVGFVKEWRRKNYAKAVMDELGWFIFISSIVVYLVVFSVSSSYTSLVLPVVIGAAFFLVATQGRHQKNPIMKVLSGILSLYGLVSYLGDVLSYSRLFALGLSTTIIAILARTLSTLFGSSPYIGWLIGLVIALIFHLFNLAMSGLGAFVHSARLQYVEFFTKFYENGGKEFKPFGYRTKYIKII